MGDRLDDLGADGVDRVQRGQRLLEDHRDLVAAHRPHLGFREHQEIVHAAIATAEQHLARDRGPRRGRGEAHDGEAGDTLAGAGLAHQCQHLAGADGEGDVVDGRNLPGIRPEADAQAPNVEQDPAQCRSSLASRASRRPSPTKLKLVTASVIARPGKMASQGAEVRYCWELLSMLPQLGSGGWIP